MRRTRRPTKKSQQRPALDPAIDVVTVTGDPLRALGSGPSESSFGFAKSLLETPRSVSFISEEQITLFGISTVEDLTRLVPGTYTTTRYGLQGGINVRGVPSDMYYRGMKRLQMQGHVRTVLSAMDGIEVIKGPPSPIYGMGRIGGFQNFTPKSSRASTGSYMRETRASCRRRKGRYDRNETQGGVGGPFTPFGKQGGYYVFGLFEDSDTYVKQVGARQEFVQATVAVDDAIGPFRLEFGGQAQRSITSGAYMNRVTQDMLDNGTYLAGQPMVNLDVDGDGLIGYLESHTASPVRGNVSSTNQPLNQRFPWPTGPSGRAAADRRVPDGGGHSCDDARLLERASRDQLPRGRRHALDAGGRPAAFVGRAAGRLRARSMHGGDRAARLPRQRRVRARAERAAAARVRRLHRGRRTPTSR